MSTVLFFVLVGLLALYGLCEGIVRFVSWVCLPKGMKPVTLVRCEDESTLSPFCRELWEEKTGHPVVFWSASSAATPDERILPSNLTETLLFLSE